MRSTTVTPSVKWAVALVVLVAALLPAPRSSAAPAPAVAGRTVVKATRTGWIPVRIPKPAKLALGFTDDFQNLDGVRFDGGKGLAALVLQSEKDSTGTYTAVRLPAEKNRLARVTSMGPNVCNVAPTCTLEPGTYRLYVVVGPGGPVKVTLDFGGLKGSTTLRPTRAARAEVSGPKVEYFHEAPYTATGAAAYGAGFFPEVTAKRALLYTAFWFRGSEDPSVPVPPADQPLLQLGQSGRCFHDVEPEVHDTAFLPGCPGGWDRGGPTALKAVDGYKMVQWGQEVGVPSGTYGLGGYITHTGIFDPGLVGFWLDIG